MATKAKSANPACTLSLRLEGVDVVFEGVAHRVTDRETLAGVAMVFRDGGWPAEVDGDAIERAAIRDKLAELESQFRAAIEGRARAVAWRGALDFPARYVLGQARAADIIVSGGPSPAFSDAFGLFL